MSWLLLSKLLPQPVFFLPLLLSSLLLPLCLAYFFPFYFTRIFFFKKGFELKESSEYVPGSYPRQRVELKNSFINHNSYFEYGTKFYLTTMAQFITWPAPSLPGEHDKLEREKRQNNLLGPSNFVLQFFPGEEEKGEGERETEERRELLLIKYIFLVLGLQSEKGEEKGRKGGKVIYYFLAVESCLEYIILRNVSLEGDQS